jgi:TetR/AcrR family transcriptional regulator, regulator of cefoperazone and chloramphenicol sensitivity
MGADMTGPVDTRQRLLEAAGEVFAERGFRNATVREICQRAGANVAAVNYHFGDKERLYAAVLLYAHHCAMEKYPHDMGLSPAASAVEKLYAFVLSFLWRILDEGQPAWRGRFLARELLEPSGALDRLVEEELRPRADYLEAIVHELLGPGATVQQSRMCTMSIVSQCLFYHNARNLLARLYPSQVYDAAMVERLAQHVTQFSLGALQHLARQAEARVL